MVRLLDYDRRRYRVRVVGITAARPRGMRDAFSLHDVGERGCSGSTTPTASRHLPCEHRHRFRRPRDIVPCAFQHAAPLICDVFDAIEPACRREAVPFAVVAAGLATEHDDDPDNLLDPREERPAVARGARPALPRYRPRRCWRRCRATPLICWARSCATGPPR